MHGLFRLQQEIMLAMLEDHTASGYDRTVLHERHSSEAISIMGSSIRLCLRENRHGERTHSGLRGYEFFCSGQGCKQIDIHTRPAISTVLSLHDTGSWSGPFRWYSHHCAESAGISNHGCASTPSSRFHRALLCRNSRLRKEIPRVPTIKGHQLHRLRAAGKAKYMSHFRDYSLATRP